MTADEIASGTSNLHLEIIYDRRLVLTARNETSCWLLIIVEIILTIDHSLFTRWIGNCELWMGFRSSGPSYKWN